jgi:hypothetical protein
MSLVNTIGMAIPYQLLVLGRMPGARRLVSVAIREEHDSNSTV